MVRRFWTTHFPENRSLAQGGYLKHVSPSMITSAGGNGRKYTNPANNEAKHLKKFPTQRYNDETRESIWPWNLSALFAGQVEKLLQSGKRLIHELKFSIPQNWLHEL